MNDRPLALFHAGSPDRLRSAVSDGPPLCQPAFCPSRSRAATRSWASTRFTTVRGELRDGGHTLLPLYLQRLSKLLTRIKAAGVSKAKRAVAKIEMRGVSRIGGALQRRVVAQAVCVHVARPVEVGLGGSRDARELTANDRSQVRASPSSDEWTPPLGWRAILACNTTEPTVRLTHSCLLSATPMC
jgi:hypothetical protein